jgi:hypothetical protein
MDLAEKARAAAAALSFLDEKGDLIRLGSLELMDYVVELEDVTGLLIPSARMVPASFESLATVAAMLRSVAEGAA